MSERKKNPHAVALGLLGGPKGGRARAKNLSSKRLSEISRIAAKARWARLSPKQRAEQTRNAVKAMVAKRLANLKARKKKQKP